MRFTSLHIKPALKGEVANVVSRRGYKAAYSSLFITTPQSRLAPCQLPVRGAFWCGANSNQKLSPQAGKVDTNGVSGRKGNGSEPPSFFTIPPQLRLRSAAPPQAVAPFYAAQARRAVPYPFAKRSFQYPHSPILYTCSRQRSLFAITPSASLESSCAR